MKDLPQLTISRLEAYLERPYRIILTALLEEDKLEFNYLLEILESYHTITQQSLRNKLTVLQAKQLVTKNHDKTYSLTDDGKKLTSFLLEL
jgi:DNA-binding HxlR family transcriptional regulator